MLLGCTSFSRLKKTKGFHMSTRHWNISIFSVHSFGTNCQIRRTDDTTVAMRTLKTLLLLWLSRPVCVVVMNGHLFSIIATTATACMRPRHVCTQCRRVRRNPFSFLLASLVQQFYRHQKVTYTAVKRENVITNDVVLYFVICYYVLSLFTAIYVTF